LNFRRVLGEFFLSSKIAIDIRKWRGQNAVGTCNHTLIRSVHKAQLCHVGHRCALFARWRPEHAMNGNGVALHAEMLGGNWRELLSAWVVSEKSRRTFESNNSKKKNINRHAKLTCNISQSCLRLSSAVLDQSLSRCNPSRLCTNKHLCIVDDNRETRWQNGALPTLRCP